MGGPGGRQAWWWPRAVLQSHKKKRTGALARSARSWCFCGLVDGLHLPQLSLYILWAHAMINSQYRISPWTFPQMDAVAGWWTVTGSSHPWRERRIHLHACPRLDRPPLNLCGRMNDAGCFKSCAIGTNGGAKVSRCSIVRMIQPCSPLSLGGVQASCFGGLAWSSEIKLQT